MKYSILSKVMIMLSENSIISRILGWVILNNSKSLGLSNFIKNKPWGWEFCWAYTQRYAGKILYINQGERLSLQYHEVKDETIFVFLGKMRFTYGKDLESLEDITLRPGDSFYIEHGFIHRMDGITDCFVIEVSTPELHDVIRIRDDYNRE